MIFTTTSLKKIDANLLFTLFTIQTVLIMKSDQKMFMKNFLAANTCTILVNINQFFLIQLTKELLAK